VRKCRWLLPACAVGGGLLGTGAGAFVTWWRATWGQHATAGQTLSELILFSALGSGLGTAAGYLMGRALETCCGND
jgi:hypothetical protein